mmetsp:Transcript_17491/g.16714  ORF Transcript_17491/g.16714 Transcript_17491/m.16714 type:complete len:210 (+) Transcript_17491:762-1391(+)
MERKKKYDKIQRNKVYIQDHLGIQKSRNQAVFQVGSRDSKESKSYSQPTYPYNKSLISYEINKNLLDLDGFNKKLDLVFKQRPVLINTHKIGEVVTKFDADYRGKLGMLDSVLGGLMNETKQEFLVKPSPYHTKKEIQNYIDKHAKKEKGKKIYNQGNHSDFQVIHIHKIPHFTDHIGNFLTKTGHKIDDFSLEQDQESPPKVNLEKQK